MSECLSIPFACHSSQLRLPKRIGPPPLTIVKVAVKLKVEVNPARQPLLAPPYHDVADETEAKVRLGTRHLNLPITPVGEDIVVDDVLPPIVLMEATVRCVVDDVVFGDDAR